MGHIARGKGSFSGINQIAIPNKFRDYDSYSIFLRSLFQSKNSVISLFGMRAIDDGVISKIFSGGSGALIAQVQVVDKIVVRKFAIDAAATKLKSQAIWIKQQAHRLPIVSILNEHAAGTWFYYDMPYSPDSRDFYEIIHSNQFDKAKGILDDIVSMVDAFHEETRIDNAQDRVVENYIAMKVKSNINIIIEKVEPFIDFPSFKINGHSFDIKSFDFLNDEVDLLGVLQDRRVCTIHGDLTIENVIVNGMTPNGWFLIDPNENNIFNSPLIDWAKLFQSLHLGYELLNRGINCHVHNNDIRFFSPRTQAYKELYTHLCSTLEHKFGAGILKEIYLHEIIHYLRLTPYKFQYGPESGLLFFANTCLLIDEYRNRYDIS